MPYAWTRTQDHETLTLWPHRSLGPRGFAWFIALTVAGFGAPLLSQLGHPTLWVLLAFILAAIMAVWMALRRNQADRAIRETLVLRPDSLNLTRQARQRQDWQANPHWVRLTCHEQGGPVPSYLTMAGNGREVEIGAFLTPEERRQLHGELARRLADLRQPPQTGPAD